MAAVYLPDELHRLRGLILEGAASPLEGPLDDAFFDALHALAARRTEPHDAAGSHARREPGEG